MQSAMAAAHSVAHNCRSMVIR